MRKKLLAMMLATAMGLSLTACGGEGGSGGSSGDGKVSITIFNSKSEVQSHGRGVQQGKGRRCGNLLFQ